MYVCVCALGIIALFMGAKSYWVLNELHCNFLFLAFKFFPTAQNW